MAFFRRALDFTHKATVTGLFGLFCYGLVQLTGQVAQGPKNENPSPQTGFFQMLKEKTAEDDFDVGHREWYEKDDDSYLKNLPRPEDYQDKK